jgi:hypothetical protein
VLAATLLAATMVGASGLAPAGAATAATAASAVAAGAAAQPACAVPSAGMTTCQIAVSTAGPAGSRSAAAQPAVAGPNPAGYVPAQLAKAYDLPAAGPSAPVTVAVVTPFDDPNVAADLAAYRSQFGLPACPQTLAVASPACLTVINETGALITPGSATAPAANASWALQTSAQLDAISAICPSCKLLLAEVNSQAVTDLGAGVNFAADLGASVITLGVAEPETNEDPAWDTAYFQHPGVAITVAAGDGGYTGAVNYPAASQYVTAVGGTTLTQAGSGTCTATTPATRGWCETAWNDTSGATASGCSQFEPEPSWQASGLPAGDTACDSLRSVPDVSADADPATGIAVYDSYGVGSTSGNWQGTTGMGGTSVAAAIVAGIYALAGPAESGTYPAAYPYASAAGLNDVTTGSDVPSGGTSCSPAYLCTAGAGYDGPTGLGTPESLSAFLPRAYQPYTGTPAAADPVDNSLRVLGTGLTDGTVWGDALSTSETWSGWQNLSGTLAGSPLSVLHDPITDNLEVFGRASNGDVYERHQKTDGTWGAWGELPGLTIIGSPSAVYDPLDNALEVWVTSSSSSGTVYEDSQNAAGTWSGWQNRSGALGGSPIAAYDPSDSRIWVVGAGQSTTGTVWAGSWSPTNGWSGWANIGGFTPRQQLSVVYDGNNGNLEAYAQNTSANPSNSSAVAQEEFLAPSGSWSGWHLLGGPAIKGNPHAVYDRVDGSVDIWSTATTGAAFENTWTSATGWSGWTSRGGLFGSGIVPVYNPADGSMWAVGVGTENGTVWADRWSPATGWSGWTNISGILQTTDF